jgi:hypothetical protein
VDTHGWTNTSRRARRDAPYPQRGLTLARGVSILGAQMKSNGLLRHVAVAFGVALVLYVVAYTGIEHRRTRHGPWRVTFTNDAAGAPELLINQPALAITNVQLVFRGAPSGGSNAPVNFDQPRPVPYALPFGQCLFMDTTFLPGTLVLECFGHEIQLIPRVLTIDKQEQPWHSGAAIELSGTNRLQSLPSPTKNN